MGASAVRRLPPTAGSKDSNGSAPESWPSASLDVDDYVLPPFLADLDDYKSKLDAIAAANFLDE